MSDDGKVVSLDQYRKLRDDGVPIEVWTVSSEADVRKWVGWDDDGKRVMVTADAGGAADRGVLMTPDQARVLGLALIGAAALSDREFRAKVTSGSPFDE